jgi:hypothetical protein
LPSGRRRSRTMPGSGRWATDARRRSSRSHIRRVADGARAMLGSCCCCVPLASGSGRTTRSGHVGSSKSLSSCGARPRGRIKETASAGWQIVTPVRRRAPEQRPPLDRRPPPAGSFTDVVATDSIRSCSSVAPVNFKTYVCVPIDAS